MFNPQVYSGRRNALRKLIPSGIILLPGNAEAAYNYAANTYAFRQDSNFSYFFGLENPDFVGIIDVDNDIDYVFGNDFEIDDIIWMGPQPKVVDLALKVGVKNTASLSELSVFINNAIQKGRPVHFSPTYRAETTLQVCGLLGLNPLRIRDYASLPLIDAIVKLRSIKADIEITEIETAIETAWHMFTTGMRMAYTGRKEQEIVGAMEGISIAHGRPVSFPIILSQNGQILHNHHHEGILPGTFYKDCHTIACETIASGLKDLGLMKGDVKEAVAAGAHALFLPHGLGHMLGMDVHDMEGLGQINVGYDKEIQPSNQFGTAYLRLGRRLQPGFVITNEPGIYFIPQLTDMWKAEKKYQEFLNYDKIEGYRDFGGIRIEDDILVTADGHRVLGKPIPKTVAEIEQTMADKI